MYMANVVVLADFGGGSRTRFVGVLDVHGADSRRSRHRASGYLVKSSDMDLAVRVRSGCRRSRDVLGSMVLSREVTIGLPFVGNKLHQGRSKQRRQQQSWPKGTAQAGAP